MRFALPVTHVYNPLDYAWAAHRQYIDRYGAARKRVVFVGMNPGPFGMTQTGVPFGEVRAVREFLGIVAAIGRPNATPGANGFEFNRPTIAGLLYLASCITGISAIIGVVLCYVWKGEPHEPWEATHYTYLIRTFWIGVVGSVAGIVALLVGIGFLILLGIAIWSLVRTVLSIVSAQKREAMKDPETLFV